MSDTVKIACSRCDQEVEHTQDGALIHRATTGHYPTRAVVAAADVTDALVDYADDLSDSYEDGAGRIDWESLIDRLDGAEMGGTYWLIDLGPDFDSPAIKKVQREIRKRRREG